MRGLIVTLVLATCASSCGPSDNLLVQNRGEGKDNWWDELPRPAWSPFERITASSQDWFEVYEVLPGIYAIYEPGQFEEVISYLVVGSERALLWDTGLGIGDMRGVVSEITELDPIVLNSHTHYDHVGGNSQFDTVWGTDTEFTRTNAAGRAHEDVAEFVSEGWIWKKTPPGFDRERYRIEPFSIDETVKDGTILDLGDRKLEVLLTPGHAPDAICLLDRDNRLLFTGDTFYPAVLYAHLPGSDIEAYEATAQRLSGLATDVDRLLPSHNEPLVASSYLGRMKEAFESITRGEAEFILTDGDREYPFEGFSILTQDPPP